MLDKDHPEWTDKLIELVRVRPGIYDKKDRDRDMCKMYWNEIFQEMIPEWENLSQKEKMEEEKMLKSRWRNLVICFQREVKKQKDNIPSKRGNRRKYIHFERLKFLLPTMDKTTTRMKFEDSSSVSSVEFNFDDDPLEIDDNDLDIANNRVPVTFVSERPTDPQDISIRQTDVNNLNLNTSDRESCTLDIELNLPVKDKKRKLEVLEQKGDDETDENKLFLDSILPSLRKMNFAQQIEAKIAFMSTIQRIMAKPCSSREEMADELNFVRHPNSTLHPQCYVHREIMCSLLETLNENNNSR